LEKAHGIILKTKPLQENSILVELLTENLGLVRAVVSNLNRRNLQQVNIFSPLCLGEYTIRGIEQPLKKIKGLSITSMHLEIRDSLQKYQSALNMIQIIEKLVPESKPSKTTFLLFKSYLKMLCSSSLPSVIETSFLAKLCKLDGILSSKLDICNQCSINPVDRCFQGEFLCNECEPMQGMVISNAMKQTFEVLANAKQFTLLESLDNKDAEVAQWSKYLHTLYE
jgi:DNA repair protein RecO